VQEVLDLEHLRDILYPFFDFISRGTFRLQWERDVLLRGQVTVEGKKLENKGDIAFAGVVPGHFLLVEQNLPTGDGFQAGDHPQGSGFAAAARTE